MPEFIVTYDLKETNPDLHAEFIKQAEKWKWYQWILVTNTLTDEWYKLPNTTLAGHFTDKYAANEAFKAALAATKHGATRAAATKYIVLRNGGSVCDSNQKQPHN